MALTVLASPGCDDVKMPYVESHRQPGDVVISVGRLYAALTADGSIPSSNTPALRTALAMRITAIRLAREKQLIRLCADLATAPEADLDRLVRESGADGVTVLAADRGASLRSYRPARARWRAACGL